jgi:hypothetical protein
MKLNVKAALFLLTVAISNVDAAAIVYPTNAPFGAKCDGVTDDAPAIQAAIASLGTVGGTVHLNKCANAYLLNSSHVGINNDTAYNLLVGSNVTLEGDPGAKLLQGPKGISMVPTVGTVVVDFSNGSNAGCFYSSNEKCKSGGFLPLKATLANSTQVTLATASEASAFVPGDYAMIYAVTVLQSGGGVLPGEPNIVTGVDPSTGALSLQYPLARSFASPYIVRETLRATWNVTLSNLIVQGWMPLQLYGVFGAVIQGNTFILDESYRNNAHTPELAAVRQVLFSQNTVQAQLPDAPGMQAPDQVGMNVTFQDDAFYVNGLNVGSEYAAFITVQGCHIFIAGSLEAPGVVVGGVDAVFTGNDVHGGSSNPAGIPNLFTDYDAGSALYVAYNTNITVSGNVFDCSVASLAYCVRSVLPGTVVMNNQASVAGPKTIGFYSRSGVAVGNAVQRTGTSRR